MLSGVVERRRWDAASLPMEGLRRGLDFALFLDKPKAGSSLWVDLQATCSADGSESHEQRNDREDDSSAGHSEQPAPEAAGEDGHADRLRVGEASPVPFGNLQ